MVIERREYPAALRSHVLRQFVRCSLTNQDQGPSVGLRPSATLPFNPSYGTVACKDLLLRIAPLP